ncbi:MAG: hypothetical protein FD166_1377 [Bacteroidetes bacterium]|nr:MAG: hypothetical protein FD166_1377 [Bacteroidota bacterium]
MFLAIAYPFSYIIICNDGVKLTLFGCSFLLTVVVLIFTNSFKGNTTMGAILKEEFDTALFDLPWKSTLKKADYAEVSKFSLQYKGKEIRDWYSPILLESIPKKISIAILQHTNTRWDIELRIEFRKWLTVLLILYTIALWIFLISINTDSKTIFSIYFSILSFYSHFITLIFGHTSTINKRKTISSHLDEIIRHKPHISINELRDIQDEIYSTRQESAKVPDFFFGWYQKRMNAIAEDYLQSINKKYS